mgnify:CR=1 FL=1
MKRLFLWLFVTVIVVSITGCGSQPKPHKDSRFLMDTLIEITAYGSNAKEAVAEAFGEFDRIHAIANQYDANSQISQVNQAAGIGPVTVDHDLIVMVERSRTLADQLDGAFDITIGPLVELWGVGSKEDYVPGDKEINQILPLVNYRLVQVDKEANTIYLPHKGMKLDMGGIAKGYATDRAIEVLKSKGIASALVNAGGNVRVIGQRPDGKPWRIGVQNPRVSDGIVAKLALTAWDTMETSGDYQRFFMKDNVRYAHILDPRTGKQPRELVSVTMVLNNSADGDIFSTALFVLGSEKGIKALEKFPAVEAVFVTVDGKVIVTAGLEGKIEY